MAVHIQRMDLSETTDKHETNMNQDNPFAKGVSINQDILMEETPRIGCVDYNPNDKDRYNADLYANHPILNRELLALGREEE